MKIHKQGFPAIAIASFGFAVLMAVSILFIRPSFIQTPVIILLLVIYILIWWFFRIPDRDFLNNDRLVYAPADGKIVVIEQTMENEYFKDERIQISIFMSPLDVHVNYYPVGGTVAYTKYHPGKYLVAWHPKSSTENERCTVVIKNKETQILVRQIAGILARRIITNAKLNDDVKQGGELGFIKFGSRVDVFLPKTAKITARLNQKSRAMKTVIAEL
ncbi:MAG TPA: phosphatidylserine decarboxylase family protein [Bacteroidales bacterium]|nr:phosphatidylserine decarboxylase family protein [Bacteroidales bacterium]